MSEQTLLHEHRLDIRWGDMDALGHVNNVIYFRYFEQARASWLATIGENTFVLCQKSKLINLLINKEFRVAHVFNLDPPHHLPDDDFNMLIINCNTLEAIDLLNLINKVTM